MTYTKLCVQACSPEGTAHLARQKLPLGHHLGHVLQQYISQSGEHRHPPQVHHFLQRVPLILALKYKVVVPFVHHYELARFATGHGGSPQRIGLQ